MDVWETALDDFENNVEAVEEALELLESSASSIPAVEQRALQAPTDALPPAWASRADELLGRAIAAQERLEKFLATAAEPRRRTTRVPASRLGHFDKTL